MKKIDNHSSTRMLSLLFSSTSSFSFSSSLSRKSSLSSVFIVVLLFLTVQPSFLVGTHAFALVPQRALVSTTTKTTSHIDTRTLTTNRQHWNELPMFSNIQCHRRPRQRQTSLLVSQTNSNNGSEDSRNININNNNNNSNAGRSKNNAFGGSTGGGFNTIGSSSMNSNNRNRNDSPFSTPNAYNNNQQRSTRTVNNPTTTTTTTTNNDNNNNNNNNANFAGKKSTMKNMNEGNSNWNGRRTNTENPTASTTTTKTTATVSASAISTETKIRIRKAYAEWCRTFSKPYNESRLSIFEMNYLKMEEYARQTGEQVQFNEFADLTPEEYRTELEKVKSTKKDNSNNNNNKKQVSNNRNNKRKDNQEDPSDPKGSNAVVRSWNFLQTFFIGAVVGGIAVLPAEAIHYIYIQDSMDSYTTHAQWQWDWMISVLQGGLFANIVRFSVRDDVSNTTLVSRLVWSLIWMKALVRITVTPDCAAYTWLYCAEPYYIVNEEMGKTLLINLLESWTLFAPIGSATLTALRKDQIPSYDGWEGDEP